MADMKQVNIKWSLLFVLFLLNCTDKKDLRQFMINSWQTTYIKIEMPTYNNSDSLYVYEDRFETKPTLIAQSQYHKDGTFSAWYLTQDGEKQSESKGVWEVQGDSLTVNYTYNNQEQHYSYHIQMMDSGFVASSLSDWDNDGKKDDLLLMKTKSVKFTE